MIMISFWIGKHKNIEKMDMLFYGESYDYGIWLNCQRAFSYGMAFLFPTTLAKRTHKKVNISSINKRKKIPYKIYALLILSLIPYFVLSYFIINSSVN